ncbi:MAG: diadenylate cyclase CdaA [Candidatus Omnitrophica bacterium]|nr:diadenylate cyclase CdaA [Candidatus Omnitrophota bacterium]MBU4303505.1 diadenylate cyclase CdaA [Candidatus Omnitrophota bacterium]MBU4419122.1 diadenylate cyclase CdaA [Candidatus Omnitrophota bacterium]MBU4467775.1 diadenylate cyclase CdaA [Candidatus Omnitrophota bacterium]MCG2707161.1 diadenylate cyclase CdaA [Candidatus Omnitrophota bacterium]
MLAHNLILYWKPAIEITILWFFIYRIMLFFEGTRALQALRGIIILLLAFLIFKKIDFLVLSWLFEKLFGISVIAILIIFHPEIRMGLAQIGKRQIFKNNLKDEEIILLSQIIAEACENLAKNKLGALIAIEKNDSLIGYIQSGEAIDARVCSDLIEAIFTPNNPLHDGGLIISQGRIAAAGCIFPLAVNQELSRVFGTRHRAALGLSEETDAILIVVSEERHDISIIYRKKFYKDLGAAQLEAKIKELLQTKEDA